MIRVFAVAVFFFGVLAGMVASGSLQTSPAFAVRWPSLNSAFPYPVISFALFAAALALRPRFLKPEFVVAFALISVAACGYLLAPALRATVTADAQSGMFEAWIALATVPVTAVLLVVAALAVALPSSRAKK